MNASNRPAAGAISSGAAERYQQVLVTIACPLQVDNDNMA